MTDLTIPDTTDTSCRALSRRVCLRALRLSARRSAPHRLKQRPAADISVKQDGLTKPCRWRGQHRPGVMRCGCGRSTSRRTSNRAASHLESHDRRDRRGARLVFSPTDISVRPRVFPIIDGFSPVPGLASDLTTSRHSNCPRGEPKHSPESQGIQPPISLFGSYGATKDLAG